MKHTAAVLLVLGVAAAGAWAGGCTSSSSFDYMQLTLQWPPTAAGDYGSNSSLTMFTIHGLWPNNYDGSYPCDCTNEQFDRNTVASLIPEMEKLWSSYNPSSSNEEFWSHEWSKHGTCAAEDGAIGNMYGFFYHTIGLRNKYSPASVLVNEGIKPSDTYYYSLSDVYSALQKGLGARTNLSCDNDNNIESLAICVSKSLTIMDCPSSSDSSCSSNVYLPATYPHH